MGFPEKEFRLLITVSRFPMFGHSEGAVWGHDSCGRRTTIVGILPHKNNTANEGDSLDFPCLFEYTPVTKLYSNQERSA